MIHNTSMPRDLKTEFIFTIVGFFEKTPAIRSDVRILNFFSSTGQAESCH